MTKKGAVVSVHEGHRVLEESLRLAVKEPKHIHTEDGGAILALCAHCEYIRSPPHLPLNCLICSKMRSATRQILYLYERDLHSATMTIAINVLAAEDI